MKLGRIVRYGFGLLLLLLAGGGSLLAWLYATESGARFAIRRAIEAAGEAITIGAIEGRFRDQLVLSDIRYRDPRVEVDIERLSLRLGLSTIFARMLVIEDLASTTVRVRWLGTPAAAQPGSAEAVRLPLTLRLNRATISGLAVERADDRLELERITVSGIVEATEAYVNRLELRALGFFLSMQGGVSWDGGLALDGLVSWSGRFRDEDWLGSADFRGVWPALEIEQEMLEPFAQTASGRVLLEAMPAADLAVDWPGLGAFDLTVEIDPAQQTVQGSIQGERLVPAFLIPAWPGEIALGGDFTAGFGENLRVASDNLHLETSFGDERIAVDFDGAFAAPGSLVIERLVATQGSNRIEAAGSVSETLALSISAALDDLAGLAALAAREELGAIELGRWLPEELSGRAAADLAISGSRSAPAVVGEIRLEDSAFAGLPLEFESRFAAASPEATGLQIERFEAALGASRLTAAGRIADIALPAGGPPEASIDLRISAELDDLAEIAGLVTREDVRELLGRDLSLGDLRGRAEAEVRLSGRLPEPAISIGLRAFDPGFASVTLSEASLEASGRLSADGWEGRLDALRFGERQFGAWTLSEAAPIRLAPGRVEIERACFGQASNSVCLAWRYGGADDAFRLAAEDLDLALLDLFLPENLTLSGTLSLDANIEALTGRPRGQLAARGTDIGIELALSGVEPVTAVLESVQVDGTLEDPALRLDAVVEGFAGGRAALRVATSDIRDALVPLSAHLDVYWPDLSGLAVLSPDIGEVDGQLSVAIDIAGTAESPMISGTAALDEGRITVPQWGLSIDGIDASAATPDGESLEFSGRGFIEGQEVRLSGVTEIDPAADWPTRLSIRGDRLPVAQRPDAMVLASPDLMVTVDLPRIDVTGSVLVPEAEISVVDLPTQAVRVSPDAVVHGETAVAPNRPLQLTADLTLELGDAVRYSGSNMSTDLSGSLRLEYASGLSPVANGNISMAGSYDAYGQNLVLERGDLLFAGPLDNPALDVLAVRRIGARPGVQAETVVGIRLGGTLRAPVPTVYSEPAMSEANALSYLMFGRPLSASDDTETATLESTALALGLQQALPAVQRVGESIGLDELSIAPSDLDAGSLMAGKYLSPKVYMSYTYGLFNRLGGFLLRYQINDRFSLETRSGDEKSMDLLYSIEKE